jgi:hypothetical protein
MAVNGQVWKIIFQKRPEDAIVIGRAVYTQ